MFKRTGARRRKGRIDARAILEAIASDPDAASTARVQACKTLLMLDSADQPQPLQDDMDALTRKAIEMGRRHG